MQKITPFLWFDDNAGEAIEFYTSVFKNSKIVSVSRNPDARPDGKSTVMMGTFEIEGLQIHVMNGGPMYKLTEAFSLMVSVETQEEVDEYWEKFTADGGKESMCGWLKDKFGVSWQIIPTALGRLVFGPDKQKSGRAMQAMMKMKKIEIAALQKAYDGE